MVRVPPVTRVTVTRILAALAVALAIAAVVTRPFLFTPFAMLLLFVNAKLSADRRLVGAVAAVVALCAVAGASIAVGWSQPLY